MTSVEATDQYAVVLKSEQPWPGVFDALELLNIVDPLTMQSPDGVRKPVGTGPFTFVEWAQGDHINVVKNKNYWQTGRPYLDEIVTTVLRDSQAMVVSLEAGAIDLLLESAVKRLRPTPEGWHVPDTAEPIVRLVLRAGAECDRAAARQQRGPAGAQLRHRPAARSRSVCRGSPNRGSAWAPSSPAYEPDKTLATRSIRTRRNRCSPLPASATSS